ncbi:zinc-binding dehydrogenase [Brucepastera parasyntrophica]|uniref:zinc-dependent alcohol dehydrogenase n=1 Tax=Brucepastera parasyntrophica TaxID=2880008 RepID=UPI00210C3CE6|nr:zinc-binding dehydrogenase [Brucepastera parasyntrophica]ULQ59274.1 zinc-binding dehydrogenase [Brucepastera parasyntrophica]
MKALIYRDVKKIEMHEIPVPDCGPDDVIVRNIRSGICGSDVAGYLYGTMSSGIFPGREFGHEMVGYVDKVGKNVRDIAEGSRVFVNPNTTVRDPWDSDMAGAFSQYVRVLNACLDYNIFPLPDSLSFDNAVLIEPFSVGTHGKNRPGIKPGDNVLIYGAGTIGLCALNALIAQGNKNVAVADLSDKRLALAESMGAIPCNPRRESIQQYLVKYFGEVQSNTPVITMNGPSITLSPGRALNIDAVIDCAGAPNIAADFLNMAKPGAVLSCIAVQKKDVPLNFRQIMSTEAVIMGSRGYNNTDIQEVISNLAMNNTRVTDIISHTFRLSEFETAFETAADPDTAIKVVFDME